MNNNASLKCAQYPATDDGLAEAVQAIDQGCLWLDDKLIVRENNPAYRKLQRLEDNHHFIGQPYWDVLKLLLKRGEFFDSSGDDDTFIKFWVFRDWLREHILGQDQRYGPYLGGLK